MRLSNFFIESIGLYLPESYSTESAVADGCLDADTRERSGWTGTAVAGDISAPDMAVIATKEALSRSRYSGEDLALILYGSSGIQGIPGWPAHHYVQRKAIGGTAAAVGIDAACNSTLLGFSLAAGYLSLLPAPRAALIAGADNWGSPEFDRYGYGEGVTDRGSNLGDAASAVIVSTETGFARVESLVNRSLPEFERTVQASWTAVSAALRLRRGGRRRRADKKFHRALSREVAEIDVRLHPHTAQSDRQRARRRRYQYVRRAEDDARVLRNQ